jgi:manganese/zinc/iron transport system substrate-binding protein
MRCQIVFVSSLLALSQTGQASPLKVVVTTPQIAEAVEKIAGSGVAVRTLVAPGIDPHTYKATPSDVTALKQADLILYSGLHLEAQMEKVFQTQRKRSMVAAVSECRISTNEIHLISFIEIH